MHRFLLAPVIWAFVALLSAQCSKAADCTWAMEPLGGVAGAPEVATANCALPGVGTVKVRRLRLNEPLAAALLLDEMPPEVKDYFGAYAVVQNELHKRTSELFRKFGRREFFEAKDIALSLNVRSAQKGEGWRSLDVKGTGVGANRVITQINGVFEWSRDENVIYPKAELSFDKRSEFPANCNMYYTCLSDAVMCTMLWRYLSPDELSARQRETEAEITRLNKERGETTPPDFTELRRKLNYLKFIGQSGWPADFLVMAAPLVDAGCTGERSFNFHPRPIVLDVLMVENSTRRKIVVRDVLGRIDANDKLRAPSVNAGTPQPLGIVMNLEPDQVAILPVRATHQAAPVVDEIAEFADVAGEMYRRIEERPANAVFQFGGRQSKLKDRSRKVRSAFKPARFPTASEYVFGPDIQVQGLVINAEGSNILGSEKTYVVELLSSLSNREKAARTAAEEAKTKREELDKERQNKLGLWNPTNAEISCPILRVYDADKERWVKRGKVLHEARGPEREMSQRIEMPISARRFSLMEEEAEQALIRRAELELTLQDGRVVRLAPDDASAWPKRILAFEKVEFAFDVPKELTDVGILKSSLELTGFYVRYGSEEIARAPTQSR